MRNLAARAGACDMPRMKPVFKLWLAGLGGAVVGTIVGAYSMTYVMDWLHRNDVEMREYAHVSAQLAVLTDLRAGKTAESIKFLEMQLDAAVLGLGNALENMPAGRRSITTDLLKDVRDYRERHSVHHRNPEVESAVTEILDRTAR
jgi:hypothetical protein